MKAHDFLLRFAVAITLTSACLGGHAAEHGYAGARAGGVYSHDACEPQATSCGNTAAGGGLFAGYQVNSWLALELGYEDLGKITADYPALGQPAVLARYTGEMQGFEIAARPFWQLQGNIALFSKIGTLSWRMHVRGEEPTFVHEASDNGWSLLLGAGAEYTFDRRWSARLEYQWIDNVGGSSTGGTGVSFATVGVAYHFGSGAVTSR